MAFHYKLKGGYSVANTIETVYDFSFRIDYTGKTVITSGGQHVRNVAIMLFGMKPGTDEYDSEMGLDLQGRKFKSYVDMTRDTEYEQAIIKQFSKYTDIIVSAVIATYMNNMLYVNMQVKYQDQLYNIEVSDEKDADLDTLKSMLVNVNGYNWQ